MRMAARAVDRTALPQISGETRASGPTY
jgi:hypothetical protein